jgi:diadenosine tetraphosphate (Ap4A) HIT family hydrolase
LTVCNIDNRDASLDCVPENVNVNALHPSCFLVLQAPEVLAFLDIMPMTRGHLLVATRKHRRKIGDLEPAEGRDIGEFLDYTVFLGILWR